MDNTLIRHISRDLGINRFANESHEEYGARLIYSALGAWGRTLVFGESYTDLDSETENAEVSYHNVDILHIQSRLAQVAYGMLMAIPYPKTWTDNITLEELGNRLASQIIKDLIFCYELSPLKNPRRLTNSPIRIAGFKDNQLILGGYEWRHLNKTLVAAGLGRWARGAQDNENYKEMFNLPSETANEYYNSLLESALWEEKELYGRYQIFKTGSDYFYYKAWDDITLSRLPEGICLLRNMDSGGGYLLTNREGNNIYTAGLDRWYLEEKEICRLMYILDKQNETPAVFKARVYDDYVLLHCHSYLPNPEERVLLLSSWSKDSYKNVYFRIIPIFVWNDIKTLLTNTGIEIKCIRGG